MWYDSPTACGGLMLVDFNHILQDHCPGAWVIIHLGRYQCINPEFQTSNIHVNSARTVAYEDNRKKHIKCSHSFWLSSSNIIICHIYWQFTIISFGGDCGPGTSHNLTHRLQFIAVSTKIAKTLGSTSIGCRSDILVSDRYIIDIDPRAFAVWEMYQIGFN